ncbi:hypothetical protein [Thermithiobacillus plumbiphilus]|uniref:DNA-binding protein n=1 Tax=Thermithiobacillus plumbiphilus TaxID=1729899 RepID=A0ABU9D5A3_9PROT
MELKSKDYYSVEEIAALWGISIGDVMHLLQTHQLRRAMFFEDTVYAMNAADGDYQITYLKGIVYLDDHSPEGEAANVTAYASPYIYLDTFESKFDNTAFFDKYRLGNGFLALGKCKIGPLSSMLITHEERERYERGQAMSRVEEAAKPLSTRERQGLLLTIGTLALMLAEKNPGQMGGFEKPNVNSIAGKIADFAAAHQLPEEGMRDRTLRERLAKAIAEFKESAGTAKP